MEPSILRVSTTLNRLLILVPYGTVFRKEDRVVTLKVGRAFGAVVLVDQDLLEFGLEGIHRVTFFSQGLCRASSRSGVLDH